jgi:exodeoxyribonuclease VII large subunit
MDLPLSFESASSQPGADSRRTSAAAGARVWAIGALLRAISDSLEARFNPVTVEGEISGFSRAASGHCYFSIKDADGQMRCAMFRRAAVLLEFSPADGQKVELRGRLGVYDARGELQLVVESIKQAGRGSLFEQFLQLKERLQAEGLFDAARKRALPPMPRAIGLVTSLGAAALHDVVTALERRAPHVRVCIYPASVQGAQAPATLRSALLEAYRRNEVDVLLLVRGGGSMEDLWAFNDEQLARTIVLSPMPLVSGVGHETDFTIADFCADVRAPTPTAAAELAAVPQALALHMLETFQARLQAAVQGRLQTAEQQLDRAAASISRPSHFLLRQRSRLQLEASALRYAARTALVSHTSRLAALVPALDAGLLRCKQSRAARIEQLEFRLASVNPRGVLQRGYAWLSDAEGQAITSAHAVQLGQAVRASLADGDIDLKVSSPRLL